MPATVPGPGSTARATTRRHGKARTGQAVAIERQHLVRPEEVRAAPGCAASGPAGMDAPSAAGTTQRRCGPPGPLNDPRSMMSHGPGPDAAVRLHVRVVVVVADPERQVCDLVRDRARVLALAHRRQSPLLRAGLPRRPRHVARRRPIAAWSCRGCPTRRGCRPSTRTSSRRIPATRWSRRSRRRCGG